MTTPPLRRAAYAFAALVLASPLRADDPPVSFAKDVAPVLVSQCLACHNARSPKGRFSVETFQSLMKGGESGPAVIPGDTGSDLFQLIEAGEMPKDGDPLPPEQVALLKRWIAEGAKLDDGKPADKPLTAIMPKPQQPIPPEFYLAPVPVTALAFRPGGSLLAVAGYHEVLLFDPNDGHLVRRIQNLAERIHGLAFSPDGQLLAVAAGTPARLGEVRLVRVDSGEVAADLAYAADSFFDVAFSPDGSRLAAVGADRTVRVWNVADGTELARIEDHADWVTAVAFSPDGTRVATASRDKTAKVFDLATKESVATFTGHEQAVLDVLFSPDGTQVLTCGKDTQVRAWNVSDAKQKWNANVGGEALSLSPAGPDAFLCGSSDRTVRLIGYDGKQRNSFASLPDWAYAAAATPDGATTALGTYDGTVTLKNRDTGQTILAFSAMPPKP